MKATFERYVFDADTRELIRDGRPMPLSPKAFSLLEVLVLCAPRAVAKQEIHRKLWPDTFVSETNLANLVLELRAALGDDPRAPRFIRTVPRFGYAFCADASIEGRPAAPEPSGDVEYRLVWGHREIALDRGENLIGRDHSAAVWINDESVSRRHARVVVDDDGATLEDLGSKNGTTLRGRAVTVPMRLQDGDEFFLGEVLRPVRFRAFPAAVSTRTGTRKGRRADAD